MSRKIRFSLLLMGAIACALLALFLFRQPAVEQEVLEVQTAALVESIEQGEGVIVLEKPVQEGRTDFYDSPSEPDAIPLALLPAAEEAEEIYEEVNQKAEAQETVQGIGILELPDIDLKMPVARGASEAALKVSAGWIPQTASIGSTGNAVIAGHRNYSYGSHFNRLGEVEMGAAVTYTPAGGEPMQFIVVETLEVPPGDPVAFEQPEGVQMLTLYTCTPVRSATHRLLVRATRVA